MAAQLGTDATTLTSAYEAWTAGTDDMFFLTLPDGTLSANYTQGGKGGFWVNASGEPQSWSNDNSALRWYNTIGMDSGYFLINIGQFPNQCSVDDVFTPKFVMKYNDKEATFDVTIKFKAPIAVPEPLTVFESQLNIVGEQEVDIAQDPRSSYDADNVWTRVGDAIVKLGISDPMILEEGLGKIIWTTAFDTETVGKLDSLTNTTTTTASPGFWYTDIRVNGEATGECSATGYGGGCYFFLEGFKYDASKDSLYVNCGQYPDKLKGGEEFFCNVYLIYGDKAYRIRYNFKANEVEIIEGEGLEGYTKVGEIEENVTLTIDRDVQWYTEKVLSDSENKYHSAWGIAMVQDVQSGDILALADSDTTEAGSDQAKMGASRAVSETFEPGSIGKVLAMSGMLQLGLHKIDDKFTVPNTVTVEGQTYKDAVDHGNEHWTLAGILEQSSNVGMVIAGDKMTNEQRYNFISKFGIGQATGLNLPGESEGVLHPSDSWDRRTRNTVLFGQGYTVNVMQLTNAVSVIANKGVKKPQRIIKSITDTAGHVEEQQSKGEATRVIDESVASQMLNAMESSAEHYNTFVKVDGYRMAAKSGTAEVAGANGQLTSIISDYSTIIPADNPRFVITVVLKDPQGSFGGLTAGPVTAEIGEFLMQKYEVPASSPRTDAIPVNW